MHSTLDCLVCFMQQTLKTTRMSTRDEALQRQIMEEVGGMLASFSPRVTPTENAVHFYRLIAERSGVPDPYREVKQRANTLALPLAAELAERIEATADPLLAAVRVAIGGNVLDDGAQQHLMLDKTLAGCLNATLAVNHYPAFEQAVRAGGEILYLADNAGEICFDTLLVRQLIARGCRVTVAVRGGPIINDAILADAEASGMDRICTVMENGAAYPGTVLSRCSAEFRELFSKATMIIAKGMGNFETLSSVPAPLFFLFTVKCTVVRDHLRRQLSSDRIEIGSPVLLCGPLNGNGNKLHPG